MLNATATAATDVEEGGGGECVARRQRALSKTNNYEELFLKQISTRDLFVDNPLNGVILPNKDYN